MTDGLDRDELIGLLDQLGDGDDQTALSAARALHAKVAASGQTWDDLLTGPAAEADAPVPADEVEDDVVVDETLPVADGTPPDDAESLRLIDRLLASATISEDLRAELTDYKADIEAGEFGADDRRYLRALARRLAKS